MSSFWNHRKNAKRCQQKLRKHEENLLKQKQSLEHFKRKTNEYRQKATLCNRAKNIDIVNYENEKADLEADLYDLRHTPSYIKLQECQSELRVYKLREGWWKMQVDKLRDRVTELEKQINDLTISHKHVRRIGPPRGPVLSTFKTKVDAIHHYSKKYEWCHPQLADTCCFDSLVTAFEVARGKSLGKSFEHILEGFLDYGCADRDQGEWLQHSLPRFVEYFKNEKWIPKDIIKDFKKVRPRPVNDRYPRGKERRKNGASVGLEVFMVDTALQSGPVVVSVNFMDWGQKLLEMVPRKRGMFGHCTTIVDKCIIGNGEYYVVKDTNNWPIPKMKKNCICFISIETLKKSQDKIEKEKTPDDINEGVLDRHFNLTAGVQFNRL